MHERKMSEIHDILVAIIKQLRVIRALLDKLRTYIQTCDRSSRMKLPAIAQTILGLSLAAAQSATRAAAMGTSAAALVYAHTSMCFQTSMLQGLVQPARAVLELDKKLRQVLETYYDRTLAGDLLEALDPLKVLATKESQFPRPDLKYAMVDQIFKSLAPFTSNGIVARLEHLMPP